MTYKHQASCFRTIEGKKWFNHCDILSSQDEDSVAAIKASGRRVRMIKHPDGFYQAFVEPEESSHAQL